MTEIIDVPVALLDDAPALESLAAGRRVEVLARDPISGVARIKLTDDDQAETLDDQPKGVETGEAFHRGMIARGGLVQVDGVPGAYERPSPLRDYGSSTRRSS